MNTWFKVLELLSLAICGVLAFMWIRHPEQEWEPWTFVVGIATGFLEIARQYYAKDAAEPRRPRFTLSNVWLTVQADSFFKYEFSATIINEGDRPDILREVEVDLYLRGHGFIDSVFVCGGRQLTAPSGQILPIECLPHIAYRIEGVGDVGVVFGVWEPIAAQADRDDYILRCRFIFAAAKPVTLRVTSNGILKHSRLRHALRELLLRVTSRGRNPFMHRVTSMQ